MSADGSAPASDCVLAGGQTKSRAQPRLVLTVGAKTVAVRREDADHWWMAHRGRREVAQRVVIRPLALSPADPKPTGLLVRPVSIGLISPSATRLPILPNVVTDLRIWWILVQRREPKGRQVLVLIDFDQRPSRLMHEVAWQGVVPTGTNHRNVATEALADALEHVAGEHRPKDDVIVARLFRDPQKPDVACSQSQGNDCLCSGMPSAAAAAANCLWQSPTGTEPIVGKRRSVRWDEQTLSHETDTRIDPHAGALPAE